MEVKQEHKGIHRLVQESVDKVEKYYLNLADVWGKSIEVLNLTAMLLL